MYVNVYNGQTKLQNLKPNITTKQLSNLDWSIPFNPGRKCSKRKDNSHKNTVRETWREDNFFYLYSSKNRSCESYFAVNKMIEIDNRGSGDTKLEFRFAHYVS